MSYPFLKPGVRARLLCLLMFLMALPSLGLAQEGANRLLSISMDAEASRPIVHIRTQDPVGYRYTVYDSLDPVRVVLDFPGMDVSDVKTPIGVDAFPLQEIRVSSFELTSGKLGRVELLLSSATPYDVTLSETDFRISFAQSPVPEVPEAVSPPVESAVSEAATTASATSPSEAPPAAEGPGPATSPTETSMAVEGAVSATAAAAERLTSVELTDGRAVMHADGPVDRYRYFALSAPPRLVVDVYGVRPDFKERSFAASKGMSGVRIGSYKDKTRVVLDAAGDTLPTYAVAKGDRSVVVSWGGGVAGAESAPAVAGLPVAVQGVDFQVQNGKSVLSVPLSGPAEIIEAVADGDMVRFGIRNATLGRALRRTVDTSAFPSAVRLITPYTVQVGESQDVRFAAELKGPVPFELRREGNALLFVVTDGPFAEAAPAPVEQVPVTAPATTERAAAPVAAPVAAGEKVPAAVQPVVEMTAAEKGPMYTGEKITLIFDDADIRRIFQLIGEVSNLNVLVGDQVKGTITLRLIDVPWDQALDLVLDIKNLGMLREGNVVRILPKDEIRSMRQAELTAVKEERELEALVTEVIGVSYTALANITGPAGELLTDRGKITPDNRNKQLIVTDIPSVIEEVKRLVAILDTPEKQVMIEARIVEASDTFTRDLGVTWNLSYTEDDVTEVSDLASGDIAGGGSFNISPTSTLPAGIGSSFTFGKLGVSSTVLDLRLSAGETTSIAKVLSKPRVTTLNGETATISQGTAIPYQTSSENEGTKTEFIDATLELNVTPVINPDDSIILEIKTSKNKPVLVAGADQPGIDKNEATTKVLVRNGETTVIGGIFTEDNSSSESGIPLLRKLPFFGHLFKSTNKNANRSELLIFITPRILAL